MSDRDLKGVAGWLWFLIVMLTVLTPLLGAGRTLQDLSSTEALYPQLVGTSQWATYKTMTWLFFAIQAAILFSAGYQLSRSHKPFSVRYAIAAMWIGGPVLAFVFVLALSSRFGVELFSGAEGAQDVGRIGAGTFWIIVWTLYLLLSRRVRNTYYGEIADGRSRATLKERWAGQPVERRKAQFFGFVWVLVVLIWAFFFDEGTTDYFTQSSSDFWSRVITWAFVPPVLTIAILFAYRRFVLVSPHTKAE